MKYVYKHYLCPTFYIDHVTKEKFIIPGWIPVHPEATMDDIEWIKPEYSNEKKVIVEDNSKEENWKFPSSSEPNIFYTVIKTGNEIKCNCAGARRSKDGECKHIKSVKKTLGL